MTLREERNEQDKQAWRAHFERERLDLSASVEAALMEDGVLAQRRQEEPDEQDDPLSVTGGTGLVPPHLNLQSRTLPAVQPESFGTVATDSHEAISSHVGEEAEQKSPGILGRLARRFTSSFAAVKPEAHQQQAASSPSQGPISQEMKAYSPDRKQLPVPLVRVIDTIPSSTSNVETAPSQPERARSLKRNGKVRLETTELPAITEAPSPPKVEDQETGETLLAADVKDALSQRHAPADIPEKREGSRNTTDRALSSAISKSLSGSGVFESEQRDVMISNSCITATSVVLVMLTTNPGPVVVQYISLHPGNGFTVHLTAPVTTRTTFNYIVLQANTF
ncbi:MAG: hypothetical protein JO011_03070 [Ktedonobacteraceae bacterium]|nr:hypothetical protein [Ktedonobacteraceae bacterium]